jgi:hypothetical protein
MSFGARLYHLSRRRLTMAVCATVALVACISTLYAPSLSPFGLHKRHLEVAAASTQLLVSAPNLPVAGPDDYVELVNQSILVGNVMVSSGVLDYVSRKLGIPTTAIQATAPMTANVPRTLIEPDSGANATAILQAPDRYKLEIQADPSTPVLHVYAQGPTVEAADMLAQSSVDGIKKFLKTTQAQGNIPTRRQVVVQQLGPVQGGVANSSAPKEIAALVFVSVFAICLWLATLFDYVRRGWSAAALDVRSQV